MDDGTSEMLEDFVAGPLVTWVRTLESLMNARSDHPASPKEERKDEIPQEYFIKLANGDFLIRIMEMIDLIPGGSRPPWGEQSGEAQRLQTLRTLLQRLQGFYQEDLQQLILTVPPNINLLARDPLAAQAVREMKKLLLLLLGSAVQCERRDEIIGHIQTLDISIQAALASAIQEVTQEPENLLRLQWKELGPFEMEQLLPNLVSRIQELVHERDEGLEVKDVKDIYFRKLWELQQEQEAPLAPPSESNHQHLGVQLAETRAQVRRLQHELEEKTEELLDQQDELKDLEGQLHKIRQENRTLAGEARLAGLYRDELDTLREKVVRTERLQAELMALKERLPALEQCRAHLKEEREFSQALMETKSMLEGQLEVARARGQRLSQLEKEKLHLQRCLNQAQEERDHLYHQTEELLRENLALESQLRQSLGESLDMLRAEELEADWAPEEPSQVPTLLSHDVTESGRLLALEQENQGLRRKLQEALEHRGESGRLGPEQGDTMLPKKPGSPCNQEEPEAGERASGRQEPLLEGWPRKAEESASESRASQALKEEAEALVAGMEATLSETRALLREAEREREAESRRASAAEDKLRSLQAAHADTLEQREEEREQQHAEVDRLVGEVQALEREREALQAGSQALQAAATRAELALGEARQSLQGEQLQGARLARKARQAEEDLREARRELEALQRGLEQHKVALAQLEAAKGALEEALSQAETQRRQLEKDNRRLKAQTQAQEEAVAAQGARLVQLEARSRQQAAELGSLQEASQRLRELEQESAGRRAQLEAAREASAATEEELQREKIRGAEREATFNQLREQLLKKEKSLQEATQCRQHRDGQVQTEGCQEGLSSGKKLEEDNSTLRRQLEELRALNQQLTSDLQQAKSCLHVPLSLEKPVTQRSEAPVSQSSEGERKPDPNPLPLQADAGSARLIEVERKNATLQAEKSALVERLSHLESQVNNLRATQLDLRKQSLEAKEEGGKWQAQNSALQVEAASLRSQKVLLDSQVSELRQRLAVLGSEARSAQQEREEWRGRYEGLLRDHDRLTVLHERQGADLEGLLGKHTSLKGALRSLEQEHRELQGSNSQFLGQKASLEQREEALQKQREHLEKAEEHHRELVEQHSQLKEAHERVKQALAQAERARDDLQGELRGSRSRLTGLQLEQARLVAESVALKEQNQQLDATLGRFSTQCELLAQLKGNQEEENRHLLQEIQVLGRENRHLLERSMESREHFQEEQRQYLDKLGELRREKQKLVEKIMDQYRVLDPALPRGKKSSWITEKIRKLMKPRRETPHEQLRPMAEGAGGSCESLAGQEGPGADRTGSSAPNSPARLHKASSTLSILEAQQMQLRRRRLSSRLPAVESPESENGEGQATPRQRFRQRRLGMLGGSREEAVVAAAEWDTLSRVSTRSQEERGPPLGEEDQTPKSQL